VRRKIGIGSGKPLYETRSKTKDLALNGAAGGDGGAQWFLRVITPPPTFGHSSPQEREDAFHANMNALEKGAQVLNKKFTGKPRGVQT